MIRYSKIAAIAMVVLLSTAICSRPVIEKKISQKGDQVGSLEVDAGASRLAYVVGQGFGDVNISFTSRNQPNAQNVQCNFYGQGNSVCVIWSQDDLHYDLKDSIKVKADFKRYDFDDSDFTFKVIAGDFVDVSALEKYHLVLNGAQNINLLVDFKAINSSEYKPESTKVQYAALLPYGRQMDAAHALNMYIKKGTSRASPKNSIVQDSSQAGIGLVKTVTYNDPDYCLDSDCKVAVHFDLINVNYFDFFVMAKEKLTPVSISSDSTILEDLTMDDEVTYVIENTYQPEDLNWKFILMPLSGDPDMAVNFDTKPAKFDDYRWKTSQDSPEAILITKKELQGLKVKGKKIYMTFKASQPAKFVFKIMTRVDESATHLWPNLPTMGEADAGEIVKYVYSTHTDYPETISVFAKLTASSGNPDLYIKDCSNLEKNEECAITKADIDNWSQLENDKNRLALKSVQLIGDDSIFLRFNCVPSNSSFDNFKFQGDEAQLFTTRTCSFAFAVHGKTSATNSKSKYILEIKGSKHHEILEFNKPYYINQGPKGKQYLKLSLDKVDPKHKYLNFRFLVNSGDFDVYHSRSVPFPDEVSATLNEHISTKIGQSVAQYEHFVTVPANNPDIKGDHYLTLSFSTYTMASVVAYTSINDAESYSGEKYQEIKFNQEIIESVPATKGASKSFYFSMDVPQERSKDTEVTLELTALKGRFKFCVSSNTTKIENESDCTWSDYNYKGNIVFNSRDKNFKAQFDYGILIKPIIESRVSEGEQFSFALLVTSQDQYTLLSPGVPYKTGMITSSHSYFQIGVNRDADFLAIVMSTEDAHAQLQISNDAEDFLSSTPSAFHRIVTGKNSAVLYSKTDLKPLCDVYKRYYNRDANMVRYFNSVQRVLEDHSFKEH